MIQVGVQTKHIVEDMYPAEGFAMIKSSGFSCADFSLNSYLLNTDLYNRSRLNTNVSQSEIKTFFDKSLQELEHFFTPHKYAAKEAGVSIHQMHMPYPTYLPMGSKELNEYLWNEVAPKSMAICAFFECPYIVIHGFKLSHFIGSEEEEWKHTEKFIHSIAPMAKEIGATICIENLYDSVGGHLVEGPCCNAKKAVERIDRINDKYHAEVLGFCFDTGHANLVGVDFEQFITLLDHRLKVLHIHDNDGVRDLHQIPFTFTKTRDNKPSTDWDGFVRGLKNIKFDKVLSFETAPVLSTFPDVMRKETLKFIAQIGTYFISEIEI